MAPRHTSTSNDLLHFARLITYKNWDLRFEWFHHESLWSGDRGSPSLVMTFAFDVTDVYTGTPIRICGSREIQLNFLTITPKVIRALTIAQIWTAIVEVETHEAMEYFMLGGRHVYDPHPQDGGASFSPDLYDPDLSGLGEDDPDERNTDLPAGSTGNG